MKLSHWLVPGVIGSVGGDECTGGDVLRSGACSRRIVGVLPLRSSHCLRFSAFCAEVKYSLGTGLGCCVCPNAVVLFFRSSHFLHFSLFCEAVKYSLGTGLGGSVCSPCIFGRRIGVLCTSCRSSPPGGPAYIGSTSDASIMLLKKSCSRGYIWPLYGPLSIITGSSSGESPLLGPTRPSSRSFSILS
jgi:hypothetical protein